MIKRLILLIIILYIYFLPNALFSQEIEGVRVICSLFSEYDFAKNIIGDLGTVELLIPPEIEAHDFEPSPRDIKRLNASEVFIYTGDFMESWAKRIASSLKGVKIINSSSNIQIENSDPHIWLDLSKAELMIRNILEGLIEVSPENAEVYRNNAEKYILKIRELDEKLFELKKIYASKFVVFGGYFSYGYLMDRYGFQYVSAYDGENEPSVRNLARVVKFIKENGNKYFLCDKFGVTKISQSIAEQTGAEILLIDSLHNVSRAEFEKGVSFIEIMQNNVITLEKFFKN